MERMKVTSHDVAERAGVSRATVSMVLNGSTAVSISTQTRERVLRAAAELGYRPNSAARMLVRGDTETIGLVATDPARPNGARTSTGPLGVRSRASIVPRRKQRGMLAGVDW